MKSQQEIHTDIERAFDTFYSIPYNKSVVADDDPDVNTFSMASSSSEEENYSLAEEWGIARLAHGISHTAPTALMVRSLINFRQNHGDKHCQFSENEIFYLQLTALLHDSAREGDAEDKWDLMSAEKCYHYLRKYYNLSADRAKFYAEAIANKDMTDKYHELMIDDPDNVSWAPPKAPPFEKPLEWQIIHDVDSLEIIRARNQYKGKLLDVAKWLTETGNEQGLDELGMIYSEYKRFIRERGDEYGNLDAEKKKFYEQGDCGLKVIALWEKEFPALAAYYNQGEPLNQPLDLETVYIKAYHYTPEEIILWKKMKEAKILARAIPVASAEDTDKSKKSKDEKYPDKAALEIKKATRESLGYQGFRRISLTNKEPTAEEIRPNNIVLLLEDDMLTAFWIEEGKVKNHAYPKSMVGDLINKLPKINTRSEDLNLIEAVCDQYSINPTAPKFNPVRSTSLVTTYIGGQVYVGAGFLIEINDEQVLDVSKIDSDSGRGKKYFDRDQKPTAVEARKYLNKLSKKQRLGESLRYDSEEVNFKHSEINYDIHKGDYFAVYFCTEPNSYTKLIEKRKSTHPAASALQSIYLQNQYEKMTTIRLPIYEYSTEGKPIKEKNFTDKDILTMWESIVTDYLNGEDSIFIDGLCTFYEEEDQLLDQIKIHALYNGTRNQLTNSILSADSHYPERLKKELNKRLLEIVEEKKSHLSLRWDDKNKKGQKIWHIVAERGHLGLMKKMAKVNGISGDGDAEGKTPLFYAIEGSYHDFLKFLIDNDVDLNEKDVNGLLPLHAAAGYSYEADILKTLIDAGIDIDTLDDFSRTTLHIAVLAENYPMITALVEKGANLNAKGTEDKTPLHVAIEQGNFDIVDYLLDEGALPNALTEDNETALHLAVRKEKKILERILACPGIEVDKVSDFYDHTALHSAAACGDSEQGLMAVKLLLKHGASPNVNDSNGKTPLHLALFNYEYEIVDALLENGADPSIGDKKGDTVFHLAVERKYPVEQFKKLIDACTTIEDKQNAQGLSILDLVRMHYPIKIVRLLEGKMIQSPQKKSALMSIGFFKAEPVIPSNSSPAEQKMVEDDKGTQSMDSTDSGRPPKIGG